MPTLPDDDRIAEDRYATLILRLVLDRRGHIRYGELIDATNGFEERFVEWRGMIHMLRVWLTRRSRAETPDEP